MNLSDVLKRAQWGKITADELSEVVRLIFTGEDADLYTLLHILGRAGSPKYRALIERYLRCVNDPQISALALKVLCRWWGLITEYRDELVAFLKRVDWDTKEYVRLQAIGLAGEYLRHQPDREILKIIYEIFCNEAERMLIRSAAYFALCRSEGVEWADMPPASRVVDLSKDIDPKIVARVQQKLRAHLM